MGSYLPSATASIPDDDPSINSTGGGRRLLNVSKSFAGWKCSGSSALDWVENMDVGIRGEASILSREPVVAEVATSRQGFNKTAWGVRGGVKRKTKRRQRKNFDFQG